ncbi:hypothetical protein AC249_AIPGENE12611 [Exaiptasia diaphana]|nr:hypothetical protein AC249_AIPGENE12611 [Exaiptasia diaphana]
MSEDLEQLGALFCAFFIVFAYDFALWVYQITSFVIFYLIDTLRLNLIRFKNVWNLHIFVVASAAFFITWFALSLNSPELDLVENVDDNFPLLQQVSENSLLFGDLNNEGNSDTAQNEKSVKDVSVKTSVCDNEMVSTDCDEDVVQSQQTSVKNSDSNEYADCNETVQVEYFCK